MYLSTLVMNLIDFSMPSFYYVKFRLRNFNACPAATWAFNSSRWVSGGEMRNHALHYILSTTGTVLV